MTSEQHALSKDSSFGNDPMICLLHDVCALSGLCYAEFWKRDKSDVELKSHEPSNDELPHARNIDVGQSSITSGQDAMTRPEVPESRHSRTFRKEVSFDEKNKSTSRLPHDDVKARRGISRRGMGNSSRTHLPSICEDWLDTIKGLEEVAKDDVCAYEEGNGVIGMAWQNRRPFWYDITAAEAGNPEASTFDARMSLAKVSMSNQSGVSRKSHLCQNVFDFCVGVPVLHPYHGVVQGVILLFHLDNKNPELPDENWKQYMKKHSVMDILAQASRTMYWTFHLGASMKLWSTMIDDQKVNSVALFMGANEDPTTKNESLPPKAWDKRTRHFLRKYFRKFKGQVMLHLITPKGSCLLIPYVRMRPLQGLTPGNTPSGTQQVEQGYVFLLINSMGAVAAMVFSVPSSPLAQANSKFKNALFNCSWQPRNLVFGHLIGVTLAIALRHWKVYGIDDSNSGLMLRLHRHWRLAFKQGAAPGRRWVAFQQFVQGQKLSSLLVRGAKGLRSFHQSLQVLWLSICPENRQTSQVSP
eukprot:753572-Hanusia_phi.AAC.17